MTDDEKKVTKAKATSDVDIRAQIAEATKKAQEKAADLDPSVPGFASENPDEHTLDQASTMGTHEVPGQPHVIAHDADPDGSNEPELGEEIGDELATDAASAAERALEGSSVSYSVDPETGTVTEEITGPKS